MDWAKLSDYTGPQASPGFQYWVRFMAWQRGLNHILRPLSLTQPQFALLATIGWKTQDGSNLSQQQLADFLRLDRMLVSQIISRLDRDGLVTRKLAANDRRRKGVRLTALGIDKVKQALPLVEGFDKAFFSTSQPT
ncbi:MarR family winged helix-turn-helix transcriptional regulator [Aquidulcibacter paucihalophilus]|uniref:MarR family winged helix-turn-helix transcriptional regulator n=1 Tax=Aquidulcibacter paucihalophilus TaxID=1978549 RepID=UPI0018E31FE5|nr:MarR family transcriptional regulator [Aquidulcibacter paucihalophilus]